MTAPEPNTDENTTDTETPPIQTEHGVLLPKGVVSGITDIKNGDTATNEEIEETLKF